MPATEHYLAFSLDDCHLALPVALVKRVVPCVEISRVPNVRPGILGMITVQGRVLPVIDIRRRLGLPPRNPRLGDRMIIASDGGLSVVLPVDSATVMELSGQEVVAADRTIFGLDLVRGIRQDPDGIICICNLSSLMPTHELVELSASPSNGGVP